MNKKQLLRVIAFVLIIFTLVTMTVACKNKQANNTTNSSATDAVIDNSCKLTEGADIRVMSYNILHPEWSGSGKYVTIVGRDTNLKNIINHYKPDVVGLQEACHPWHFAVEKYLVKDGDYAFACASTETQTYNMTTFIYNKKTVKLVEEYVIDLDRNSDIRVLSVAVFEKLSNGKQFVATNTHPSSAGYYSDYKRNFADLTKHIKTELEKYKDLPVIITGDFNTREQSQNYKNFMNDTGSKDAKYEADQLVREYCTFIGWPGQFEKGNRSCIDHIFVNHNTDVLLFDCVVDCDAEKTSDHLPIYADIALK